MTAGIDESSRDERLYDDYLELALAGDAPEPEAFLAERGVGAGSRDELLERLRELRRAGAAPAAAFDGPLPFETLGEYRLIERIGRGGMGLVFLAEQPALERRVALKVLRPELAGSNLAAERFKREARAVAKLRHPGIVAVHGFGEERGVRYLAMEYLPGRTLEEELERAPVPLARKVRWIRDLARALDYAHAEGVIHRDVKPSNVRVTPDDRALLVDFGLVRSTAADSAATLTDSFAGSPAYASPEQISGSAKVDARTDVYSLGVTLYRCATGIAPFEGESVEQVFQRILAADPVPPRRIDPTIPRDLEIVVLKAIERAPERRYATAGELADDLDAVLELRPIRARPPGSIERATRLVRRHKVASASVATAMLALAGFAALRIADQRASERRRGEDALAAVAEARERVGEYRRSREELAAVTSSVDQLRYRIQYGRLTPEEYRTLDVREGEVDGHERRWQTTFYEVLDLLRHAERLDASVEGADAVRAELYLEKYREARATRHDEEAEFYRELALQHDARGALLSELGREASVSISTDPPGAAVYLFRYEEHASVVAGGARREVPVPVGDREPPAPPGTFALRVLEPLGELRAGDHVIEVAGRPVEGTVFVAHVDGGERAPPLAFLDRVIEVDGLPFDDAWAVDNLGPPQKVASASVPRTFVFETAGERRELRATSLDELGIRAATPEMLARSADRPAVPCVVVRDGARIALELPPGVETRTTAAPLFASERCKLGVTPIEGAVLASGDYVALIVLDGREPLRHPFSIGQSGAEWSLELDPLGTTPAGFVALPRHGPFHDVRGWIQEREVTSDEYLEFLNDPATLAEIARSRATIRFPREGAVGRAAPLWKRGDGGRWEYSSDWRGDYPVVCVSWDDAQAYVRWRNERARAASLPYELALPTLSEFELAGLGTLPRHYTWGNSFRPTFARTCFARSRADIGAVLQFPVDESPLGAFDFCGSAGEWLATWYDEARNLRHLGGGAWGQGYADTTKVSGGNGLEPDQTTGETGFRLLAREVPR